MDLLQNVHFLLDMGRGEMLIRKKIGRWGFMKTYFKVALVAMVGTLFTASLALAQQAQQQKQWTFDAEALFLHRNATKGVPVVKTTDTSRLVLGTNNLKFGFRPGARFTLGYHPDPSNTVEAVYFGLQQFRASASARCPSNNCLTTVFAENGSGFFNFDDISDGVSEGSPLIRIKYESRLHNVELNYKHHFSPWGNFTPTLLTGFRFMSVPERFNITAVGEDCCIGSSPSIADYKIKTTNYLFGVQIGGDGTYRFGPSFDVGLRAKVGLFANRARQRTQYCSVDSPPNDCSDENFRGRSSRTGAAGVAEAGLFATWNLHQNVALTAGYQILYIAGLALAPEQMATSNSQGALSQLNNSGSAFYHGPSVGVKVGW